jgi:hypothetical protein
VFLKVDPQAALREARKKSLGGSGAPARAVVSSVVPATRLSRIRRRFAKVHSRSLARWITVSKPLNVWIFMARLYQLTCKIGRLASSGTARRTRVKALSESGACGRQVLPRSRPGLDLHSPNCPPGQDFSFARFSSGIIDLSNGPQSPLAAYRIKDPCT